MKRKAEIKVVAYFVITGELTDAKWKKLVGDYFEPNGNNWSTDHPWIIESWAEEEVKLGMAQHLTKVRTSIDMEHCAARVQGWEKFNLLIDDVEVDAIELTDSL